MSTGADAGMSTGPCEVDVGPQPRTYPGDAISIPLPGCPAGVVTVIGPDGGVVASTQGTVSFTPTESGVYEARIVGGGETTSLTVLVDARLAADAGFDRRYVDRLDTCATLTVTSEQTLLCLRPGEGVTAYDRDGGAMTRLPGTRLRVVGNEVWITLLEDTVRHYTDTGDELRLDAELSHPLIEGDWGGRAGYLGATLSGRTIESSMTGFVQLQWDGGTLEPTAFADWDLTGAFYGQDVDVDGQVWADSSCLFEKGCATTLCRPVVTCPFGRNTYFVAVEEEFVWVADAWRSVFPPYPTFLALRPRPIASSSLIGRRSLPPRLFVTIDFTAHALILQSEEPTGPSFIPRRVGDHILLTEVPSARVATRDWILGLPHPQIVRFWRR